jgi:hypothetical protein
MRYNFVCALANDLKDKEAAMEMLGSVLEKIGRGLLDHLKVDPDMACIRDDPRIQAMLAVAEKRVALKSPPAKQDDPESSPELTR